MSNNISPGVYTQLIDLSTYVATVPASIGLFCILSKKGSDNQLIYVGSRADFVSEFGEPNINDYGQAFSQAPYFAYNFLGESGGAYVMRCLPDDAQYANLAIRVDYAATDSTPTLSLESIDSVNSMLELNTKLDTDDATSNLLGIFYPIGRGQEYDKYGIRISDFSNPMYTGVYVLDVYEKQSDGGEVIIESFEVSFELEAVDSAGESLFVGNVLEKYSSFLRFSLGQAGYDVATRVYDHEVGSVSVILTDASASLTDTKQNFRSWQKNPESGYADYIIVAKDGWGETIWGYIGVATGTTFNSINVFNDRNLDTAAKTWIGDTTNFDAASVVTYRVMKTNPKISDLFTSAIPVSLKYGTDGSLLDASGDLVPATAIQVLSQGYSGLLLNPTSLDITAQQADLILDTESIEFNLVFDGGYPAEVKDSIANLAITRNDCVAILDNGDNPSSNKAIAARQTDNTFNNFLVTLYEGYNKIYDPFTGQSVWFSPLYHMSYLLPRNDSVAEIWYAAAGLNRGMIQDIEQLRYNPKLAQRDQLYLSQLNPIVNFTGIGFTVWGQLTSQTKPSAMTDLNIVRLYLYVKAALKKYCKYFVFELNDPITYGQIKNGVVDFLENVKQRRGLYDYAVEVGATEYERKHKQIHVNITLNPTRVIEIVNLNFTIV